MFKNRFLKIRIEECNFNFNNFLFNINLMFYD